MARKPRSASGYVPVTQPLKTIMLVVEKGGFKSAKVYRSIVAFRWNVQIQD
jgi:hypothetical protein